MAASRLDVVGIGNAIVDVLSHADDAFLSDNGLAKGMMTLMDSEQAESLYGKMGPGIESSGGSAANTIAVLASMGGRGAFVGKVADDQLGTVFRHDIRSLGVQFDTPVAEGGAPTARCLILVTPDAQRTMNTFLGACVELGPDDVLPAQLAEAQVTYLEGYLWDPEAAKQAFLKAAAAAHEAGNAVALSLSDPFCVERHRDEFKDLVTNHVDILFANEQEIMALYQVNDFDAALQAVRGQCRIAALTRGEAGAVIVAGDEVHVIDAEPITNLVDTTGAGDAFAAGFLYGYTRGMAWATCGRLGCAASAETIQHMGPRPENSLAPMTRRITESA